MIPQPDGPALADKAHGLSAVLRLDESWSAALAADTRPSGLIVPAPPNIRKPKKRNFRVTAAARTMTVEEVARLSDREAEKIVRDARWPEGMVVCPICEFDECREDRSRNSFRCRSCYKEFTTKSDTTWHASKISYRQILLICYFFANSPRGISALTLSIWLGLDPKVTQFLLHKIRESIVRSRADIKLSGIVEIDGVYFVTYIRPGNIGRRSAGTKEDRVRIEACVISLVQRGGPAICVICEGETSEAIRWAVQKHVEKDAIIITDEWRAYRFLRFQFEKYEINHSIKYAEGDVFTNNAESLHARMRKAQKGTYNKIITSPDFDLYIGEISYRHSQREVDSKTAWMNIVEITANQPPTSFKGCWD